MLAVLSSLIVFVVGFVCILLDAGGKTLRALADLCLAGAGTGVSKNSERSCKVSMA